MGFKVSRLLKNVYICVDKGDFAGAVAFLEQAIEISPENEELHAYLGEAYILNQQYQQALKAFATHDELILKSYPLTSNIEGYRGRVLLEQGKIEQAQELLEMATSQVKDPEIYYSLGLLHLKQQDIQKAHQTLEKIEEIDPSFFYKKIQFLLKQVTKLKAGDGEEKEE